MSDTRIAAWVDAFTVQLEVLAEGYENPLLKHAVADGLKAVESAHGKGSKVAQNQMAINQRFATHEYEQWRAARGGWKALGSKLVSLGWGPFDMAIERDPFGRKDRFLLAHDTDRLAKPLPLDKPEALLVAAFLSFVNETAKNDTFDPRDEMKTRLAGMGVTKENFPFHAERLGVSDPWADERNAPEGT